MSESRSPKTVNALARARGQSVVTIKIDGRTHQPPLSSIDYVGPVTDECVQELTALLKRWLAGGKA